MMAPARAAFGIPRAIAGRVAVATATRFGILTAHSILETARDALFLSSLSASRLPRVYLVIAGLAVVVVRLNHLILGRSSGRATLALTLFGSAVCTALFWLWAGQGETSFYGLYVWTGLIATIAVAQLWLLVGHAFDPGQAKRAFAVIGGGGLIGATFGSALAGVCLRVMGPRDLVLVASAVLALSAVVPALGRHGPAVPDERRSRRPRAEPQPEGVLEHPYLRRLLLLVALTQIATDTSDAVVGLAAHYIAELDASQITGPDESGLLSSLEQRTGSWIDAANQVLHAMRATREPLAG